MHNIHQDIPIHLSFPSHLFQSQCSTYEWGHVPQLCKTQLAGDVANSLLQFLLFHHHHKAWPSVFLLLDQWDGNLSMLSKLVMKMWKWLQGIACINSQMSLTKPRYMSSLLGGALPLKKLLRTRDVSLWCIDIY